MNTGLLSPLGMLLRDAVITTVTIANSRLRWLVCGSGRSGVTTLLEAFQTRSDVIPDMPTTEEKVQAKVIKGLTNNGTYRFRTADMRNQPDGRYQYLEEIINRPIGVLFVFKTFKTDDKGNVIDSHLEDKSEFKKTKEGHIRHEADYQQLRWLTNAFLYPETLEKNYPEIFKETSLKSDIRNRYVNNYSGSAPKILMLAGNFMDVTYPTDNVTNPYEAKHNLRHFLRPYMESFQPLTDQWARFARKGGFIMKSALPPCAVKYTTISAKYHIGVDELLSTMKHSVGLFGG